jgi:hypothetical protein
MKSMGNVDSMVVSESDTFMLLDGKLQIASKTGEEFRFEPLSRVVS